MMFSDHMLCSPRQYFSWMSSARKGYDPLPAEYYLEQSIVFFYFIENKPHGVWRQFLAKELGINHHEGTFIGPN